MTRRKAYTLEERLAAAEALAESWKAQATKVQGDLTEATALLHQVDTAGKEWKATADRRLVEVNKLRGMVRDLELTVERHRGYLDGTADAQPPRMIPEQRELRREVWRNGGSNFDPRDMIVSPRPFGGNGLPWWHK